MKKNVVLVSVMSILVLAACSRLRSSSEMPVVPPTMYPSLAVQEYFPLNQGAYWVYEGNVKWTVPNSADVAEEEISWKMEVQRVFHRNAIAGYEMRGAPWDLAWYERGKEPSEYGIIQAGGRFYRTSLETVWRLMDETDVLRALVRENEIFLDVPLIPGKKFCDTFSISRADGMYCWSVGDAVQLDTTNIEGMDSSTGFIGFPINNGTMPDHSMIEFVPGIGISRYVYRHHGTISDVDVHLVEYHAGE